jgi:hypothetical protein
MQDDEFEWFDAKAARNWRDHDVGFEMARDVFKDIFAIEWADHLPCSAHSTPCPDRVDKSGGRTPPRRTAGGCWPSWAALPTSGLSLSARARPKAVRKIACSYNVRNTAISRLTT